MKLYDFANWNQKNRVVELTDLEAHEPLFVSEFSKIKRGWTVVDVGARIGYYTIKGGLLVGNRGRILSFEPHPENCRVLKMNIELYELDNVVPVCMALGDHTGMTNLYEAQRSGGTHTVPHRPLLSLNWQRLFRWLRLMKEGEILRARSRRCPVLKTVPINTLDNVLNELKIKDVDLIKIDVEGAELQVLKGGYDVLKRDKPILLVEIHPQWGIKPSDVCKFLYNFEYDITTEEEKGKVMLVAC